MLQSLYLLLLLLNAFYALKTANAASAQLHLDPKLEPSNMTGDEKFVFAVHPHGVMSDYRILMDGVVDDYFPKVLAEKINDYTIILFLALGWRDS